VGIDEWSFLSEWVARRNK